MSANLFDFLLQPQTACDGNPVCNCEDCERLKMYRNIQDVTKLSYSFMVVAFHEIDMKCLRTIEENVCSVPQSVKKATNVTL